MSDSPPASPAPDLGLALRRHAASWLDWLSSRKTKTILLTVGLAIAAPHIGIPAAVLPWLLGLGGAGVVGQGLADINTGGSTDGRRTPKGGVAGERGPDRAPTGG